MVNLTIDGKQISVKENTTIMEAADQNGITIPSLCYLKGINEIAALITDAGPLAQSPPANTPGRLSILPLLFVTIFPRFTDIPASSKCFVSIFCPIATTRISHGM